MAETPAEQFIETMGLMAQSDGAPRIAGQILGYLVVAGEPRTLQQMAEDLSISKASASTNARLLESRGLLRRVSHLGARQDGWETVQDPNRQMLTTLAAKFRRNAEDIRAISATFPDDPPGARERVEGFAEFYRQSADFLTDWLARVPAVPDERPAR